MSDVVTQLRDWLQSEQCIYLLEHSSAHSLEAANALARAIAKLDSLQSDADTALRHRLSQYSLTPKEMQVAVEIEKYRREHKVSPTFQELSDILSVSKVTIFEHVRNLKEKGALIRRRKNGHRNRSLALAKGVK